MPDLFRQSIGMKNLKYCAAVGGFATLRMRHAPCGYTKYSCVFHTSTCQKISRRPLLLIESELPDTLLFRGAAWDKCKMESGKFPAARCRGGACRSRHCTAESYRLTIKTYKPIASVAALSERLAGWQYLRHGFNGMRLPGLSLRGPNGAVAISGRQLRFRRGFPVIHSGTARLPRRFAPCNDTSGECGGAPAPSNGLMTPYKALTDCRYTPYFGAYRLTTACLLRQCSAGPGCPLPYNA